MARPTIVRIRRRADGTLIQGCDIYIGRACFQGGWNLPQSKWHNPFTVYKYGRQGSLSEYRRYIQGRPDLLNALDELTGKTLGCWCHPEPCHGDVLVELWADKDG